MARAALEATAKHKDYTKGTLQAKLKAMVADQVLRADIGVAADELKFLGNRVLHADDAGGDEEQVTEKDAEDALWLLGLVLHDVFQATTRLNEIKARRTATTSES